jgi:broad specificity phosphatase PhoE
MNVYFIRHGESEANKLKKIQSWDGSLSDLGRKQALFVTKRFENIPIDLIVSSPVLRTHETTEIINKALQKEVVYSEFFTEWLPPNKFVGMNVDDPVYLEYLKKAAEERKQNPNWIEDDGDTFESLKTRAMNGLNYLKELKKENVLVVTHAGILRMFVALVFFGEELTYHEYTKVFYGLRNSNTSITLCDYFGDDANNPRKHGWKLVTWNDHAHLGELK